MRASFKSGKSMPKQLLWRKSCLNEVVISCQGWGTCDPQTLTSWHPISTTLHSWNIHLLQSVIFNSHIDNHHLGGSYPKLVWTMNQWMTICSNFVDQLIGFEMMEAFVSAIQTIISPDSPFSKITQIYNLALKLLRLRSKRLG